MSTNKKIVKPSLATVAPLTNAMVNMFIWLNVFIGISVLTQAPNPGLIIINSYALTYVWGGVFILLGILLLVGKLLNNWGMIEITLVAGLFTKLVFAYALIVLGFQFGWKSIIGILSLWVAIVWVQFFTVRHFNLPGGRYAK